MCKYCTEYEDLPELYHDGEFIGRTFNTSISEWSKGKWYMEIGTFDIPIRYCPFCGEDLAGKED